VEATTRHSGLCQRLWRCRCAARAFRGYQRSQTGVSRKQARRTWEVCL